MSKRFAALAISALALAAGATSVMAQQAAPARPSFTPDGVVHVPAFELPASAYLSPEARAFQEGRARMRQFEGGAAVSGTAPNITQIRAMVERQLETNVAAQHARYQVDVSEQTIAGVRTRVFTPRAGEANRRRVLINLHGGGFSTCAIGCAIVESVPVAAVARIKVVSVDYRQGPEHRFPAASEDVAAVYRDLLRTYRPENIGIYGCSAGGALTAQTVSWLQAQHLPRPGAVGIFGAGAVRMGAGDSAYIAAYIDGSFPPPSPSGGMALGYFEGADMSDPLISPALHREVTAQFPPALIITGTRAMDLSPAIVTNTALLREGVESQLVVGEGMGHCYLYNPELPESRDAYDVIARFFDRHLGARRSGRR